MFKHRDQADGLRRLMSKSPTRFITVIPNDATSGDWLTALAASMVRSQENMLVIHDKQMHTETPPLEWVMLKQTTLSRATTRHPNGFDLASLLKTEPISSPLSNNLISKLNGIVKQLAESYDTVMIETYLESSEQILKLPLMLEHELVVQMDRSEDAIKNAYLNIKRICQQYGNRSFGVVVTRADQTQGQLYFKRLSQVCQQFLGVTLSFLGAIPDDEALKKSSVMGLNVIDAFPKAQVTVAIKALADRLQQQRIPTASLAVA